MTFGNTQCRVSLDDAAACLWRYLVLASGREFRVAAPVFEVDGTAVQVALDRLRAAGDPIRLPNGCSEHCFEGEVACDPALALRITFRLAADSPVVRFRYALRSRTSQRLTKISGRDDLSYLAVSLADLPAVTEIRLSEFNEMVHSYTLVERPVETRQFEGGSRLIGPLLVAGDGSHTMLAAYEHGATAPDAFLEFALSPDRTATLTAVKGNYCNGQIVDPERPYETIWLQFAAVAGDRNGLAQAYRRFALHCISENGESRKPYLCYNTWNYQERNHYWNGKPYLDSMNEERMLQEIEVARRLGIEVFVIDTGWYEKTGDWQVSSARFADGLTRIRQRLESHGMKLGLWFDPTAAAASSTMLQSHRDCVMSWRGRPSKPRPIWETEESYQMCLVSRYADAFAEKLIRLHRELGVTYFKWDAVGQYGCDDPGHDHGGPELSAQERADCYAFQLGLAMQRIAERVREWCPDSFVDFDVTEAGRYVGLGWLAASRYYLVNNGPYYPNYDLPLPADQNWNMFFYPGPARGWICRTPLSYDAWVPSVLFMTHYFPDEPESSQILNIASLVLGQNGIWGDLVGLGDAAVGRFGGIMSRYKQVRDDITESYPVRSGPVAGTPEVHEKIRDETGRGVVAIFSTRAGSYTYVTQHRVAEPWWHTEGIGVSLDSAGRARIEATFSESGAEVVLFGVQ